MISSCSGYTPPEYVETGRISEKFDVFSLGLMIIEIMTGHKKQSKRGEMSSKQFIDVVSDQKQFSVWLYDVGPLAMCGFYNILLTLLCFNFSDTWKLEKKMAAGNADVYNRRARSSSTSSENMYRNGVTVCGAWATEKAYHAGGCQQTRWYVPEQVITAVVFNFFNDRSSVTPISGMITIIAPDLLFTRNLT